MEELTAYRREARRWIEATLRPRSSDDIGDPRGFTPEMLRVERDLQRIVFEGGYAGITWPVDHGGQGLTPAHERAFLEEAHGHRLPDLGVLGRTTYGICAPTMLAFAPAAFLDEHIPRILRGDELWVQLFSEPAAGSDLAGVLTRATRNGDGWLLTGAKTWSSGAYYADYGLCLARTDWDVPKHRGLTWFAVEMTAPGVSVRRITQINGDAEFCEEFLDDVVVPDAHRIGPVDDGWTVARAMLAAERGVGSRDGVVATSRVHGVAADLHRLALRVDRADDPIARDLIARAHVIDVVQQELTDHVGLLGDAGVADPSSLAAYPKLAAGTMVPERAALAMQIARGAAVLWDDPGGADAAIARSYLTARGKAIAGGTNEMMRNVIGEHILRLPRERSVDTDVPFSEVVRNAAAWDPSRRAPGPT